MKISEELQKKIEDAIKNDLPAQVGSVLKGILEQAEKDAAEVEKLKGQLKISEEKNSDLNKRIRNFEDNDRIYNDLDARAELLNKRENEIRIKELESMLEVSNEKVNFVKDVAMGLVRNTEFRRTIFDTKSEPGIDQWNNPTTNFTNRNITEQETNE